MSTKHRLTLYETLRDGVVRDLPTMPDGVLIDEYAKYKDLYDNFVVNKSTIYVTDRDRNALTEIYSILRDESLRRMSLRYKN